MSAGGAGNATLPPETAPVGDLLDRLGDIAASLRMMGLGSDSCQFDRDALWPSIRELERVRRGLCEALEHED